MNPLFDTHVELISRSLDFRAQRQALLAGNLANVETPGYQAKDLLFERALGDALQSHQPGPLQTTNARHFNGLPQLALQNVQGQLIRSGNPTPALDANTVDLEKEAAKQTENRIAYAGLTRMLSHKFQLLRTTIESVKQP